jgi:hypothetical protein
MCPIVAYPIVRKEILRAADVKFGILGEAQEAQSKAKMWFWKTGDARA